LSAFNWLKADDS